MANLTPIATPAFTTTWNGTDAYENTQSITVPAGTTHLVVRAVNSSSTMPSMTFNGAALTVGPIADDTNLRASTIYYLANPDIGTFDLVTNSAGVGRTMQLSIDAVSGALGVGDTDFVGGYLTNSTLSLTTAVDDLVVDILSSDTAATSGTGQSDELLNTGNASASSETATTTTTDMSWTFAGGNAAHVAMVFTDGSPAPTVTPGLPATIINQSDGSTPLASTQVALTVTNATDIVLYDGTPTTDASGILAALDLSAHASEPAVDDVVTYSLVYDGITYEFSRTLEDIGA